MTTDCRLTDTIGNGEAAVLAQPPAHLHLRAQEGLYALYATPLPLRLCADTMREYLHGYYLLLLSWSGAHVTARAQLPLAQWLRQQGLQAHTVRSAFALVPAQYMDQLARLPRSYLAFADTPFAPDDVARVDVGQMVMDTFASPRWHTVINSELGNRLYYESRDDRFTQILCNDRALLADVLSCWLRTCLQWHLPDLPPLEDFPALIHEQLWQYAAQGLAPRIARRTPDSVEVQVELGTPDRSACVLAQSCPHVSQVQRGFILRWHSDGWDICSTEDMGPGQS